jgi:MFS family permease
MFTIPLYFQVTKGASPSEAGLYLVPSIVGNTVGALLTGIFIKRTGRYKLPTILASVCSGIAFTALLILWRGDTNWLEALIVFPAGFGTGIINSSVFVGLTSGVAEDEVAIAGSGLYLSSNIGAVAGISGASAIYQFVLQRGLKAAVAGRPDGEKVLIPAIERFLC